MKQRSRPAARPAGLTLGVLFFGAASANAYIDPGSGSIIFQIAIGALLASAVAIKAFWRRIVAVFARRSRNDSERVS